MKINVSVDPPEAGSFFYDYYCLLYFILLLLLFFLSFFSRAARHDGRGFWGRKGDWSGLLWGGRWDGIQRWLVEEDSKTGERRKERRAGVLTAHRGNQVTGAPRDWFRWVFKDERGRDFQVRALWLFYSSSKSYHSSCIYLVVF